MKSEIKHLNDLLDGALREKEEVEIKIERALSFIGLLHNDLKNYTEYQEYTNIFNEMLKDIEKILGDKEDVL